MSNEKSQQSSGASHGDNAQGNTTISGGVSGDMVGGDKNQAQGERSVIVKANLGTIKTGDEIHHHYWQSLPPALHQLPPPPADFTGREAEIEELLTALEDASLSISALQGMGGVGKTVLALKLAEKIKERYPDGQVYLDLKGISPRPLTQMEIMSHVIRAYHPETKLPESETELRSKYFSVLHDRRVLILMDNAKDERQIESLMPPSSCALLVTSRQRLTLPGLFSKSLNSLLPADASKLLLAIAPRIGDLSPEIAKLCGCLPLALRLAASAIAKRPNIRLADYARRLASAQEQLKLIEASLSLSYEILSEELRQWWRMLAVFPGSFDEEATAAVWETDGDKALETLGELLAFSLVEWNETSKRYRLHDLARVFAESRMREAESEACRRLHAQHYQGVLSDAEQLYQTGGDGVLRGLELYDLERMNIDAGQAWTTTQSSGDEAAAELCITYSAAGVDVLYLRQHPHERIQWFEAMLAIARRLNRRDAEGLALGNMGHAYYSLGETRRAIEFYEQHLQIARETGDRRGEGNALGNLGVAYYSLGEARRAIEFYEQHLHIARETGDRSGEGTALGNLGLAYVDLGEARRAIEFHERRRSIACEDGDRRGEGSVLGNLGLAYADLGETHRAIEFYERHLQVARETGDRRGEGNALGNLGLAYADLGETHRAIEFYEQVLAITRETGDRRGEGTTLGNLGAVYAGLGETHYAIEFHAQHLAITRETGDRKGEGRALWNLARGFDKLEERSLAVAKAEAALVIFEKIESPHAEMVRGQLAEWGVGKAADQT